VLAIVGGEGGNSWTGGFLERIAGGAFRSIGSGKKLKAVTATTPRADLLVLKDLVEGGQLRPVVHRRYALSEAAQAIKDLAGGQVVGKSVVVID
jgi:NADPH:quinone reductase-like Zn-dependent oxidoreductase